MSLPGFWSPNRRQQASRAGGTGGNSFEGNIEVVNHQLISNETVFTQLETKQLLQVIQELPDRMRMVINLFAIEGYKHEEIAEKLGISVGTSKSNLFDDRKQIKKRIGNELKNIA